MMALRRLLRAVTGAQNVAVRRQVWRGRRAKLMVDQVSQHVDRHKNVAASTTDSVWTRHLVSEKANGHAATISDPTPITSTTPSAPRRAGITTCARPAGVWCGGINIAGSAMSCPGRCGLGANRNRGNVRCRSRSPLRSQNHRFVSSLAALFVARNGAIVWHCCDKLMHRINRNPRPNGGPSDRCYCANRRHLRRLRGTQYVVAGAGAGLAMRALVKP